MKSTALEEIYLGLTDPQPGSLNARVVPGGTRYRVGRAADGTPRLLIEVGPEPTQARGSRLKHIEFAPRERVRIEEPGAAPREGVHAVLACRDADDDLRGYFFRIAWMLVEDLGPSPTADEVDRTVKSVLDLFGNLEQAGTSTVQGLWAELLLIAHAREPVEAVKSWHAMPREKFDFVSGSQRLEVKSTLDEIRIHQVSLEQVRPAAEGVTLLASFMIERARDGATVGDLVELIREKLPTGNELRLRIERIVARSVGTDWAQSVTARFDIRTAIDSLRVYDARDVPSVSPDYPPEVRDVRFGVDLSSVPALAMSDAIARGSLFDALLPPPE